MVNVGLATYLLVLVTTVCTICGQLVLKKAAMDLKALLNEGVLGFMLGAATTPAVYLALSLQVIGYAAWFVVLTRENLSVAFALSGSTFYLLMALSSWWVFDERLGPQQWLGLVLISIGVALVTTYKG